MVVEYGDVPGLTLVTGRRDDHHDAPAPLLRHHEPGHVLGAEKRAGEIHRDLSRPPVEGHVEHAQAAEDARVVDEEVDASVGLTDAGDHGLHLLLIRHVAGNAEGGSSPRGDPLRALPRIVRPHVHAHHGRPFVGQSLGDTAPDIGTGAGHDRHLGGETAHARGSPAAPTVTGRGASAPPRPGDLRAPRAWPRR